MTQKELSRYEILKNLIARRIKEKQAAIQMGLSIRHIRRLKREVIRKGARGIIHKNRGKESHNKINDEIRRLVTAHIKKDYLDFGPTLAQEKLDERNNIKLSVPTVRAIMIKEGIWQVKGKRKTEYHAMRERKEHLGELVQFDGSYHDWFENGEKHCLLAGIDDSTGYVIAKFAPHEGSIPVFSYWKKYLLQYGKPVNIYVDKLNTYKVNIKSALANLSQFERAMEKLGIEVIHARSPQAKGRVERLFGTFQDRLIKEMRLEGIKNPKIANKFLEKVFLPKFNAKFNVIPKKETDLHRKLNSLEKKNLDQILSVQNRRCVNNDFTVRFWNRWFQLKENQSITVRRGDDILIEERVNGKMYMRKDDKYLNYIPLSEKPAKIIAELQKEGVKINQNQTQKCHNRKPFWKVIRESEPLISYTY
jgi:hypothetical protein